WLIFMKISFYTIIWTLPFPSGAGIQLRPARYKIPPPRQKAVLEKSSSRTSMIEMGYLAILYHSGDRENVKSKKQAL
ncbi:hypothetical protein, partial [Acidaminococcus timonensis]|uniref:hypothetical protein n=1 Tax=Acidaminococcus timonensis TaxID=1871002 RepID=UPI00308084C2